MELHCDLLPPPRGPKFDFWTPGNAKPERVLCISAVVWAHITHWTGKNTQPCTLKLGLDGQVTRHCDHCKAQLPNRWKGYLHVFRYSQNAQAFLCLTESAGTEVMDLQKKLQSLRGVSLDVWRVNGKMNAALCVKQNTAFDVRETNIPELDPGPYLDTVFRRRKPLEKTPAPE